MRLFLLLLFFFSLASGSYAEKKREGKAGCSGRRRKCAPLPFFTSSLLLLEMGFSGGG